MKCQQPHESQIDPGNDFDLPTSIFPAKKTKQSLATHYWFGQEIEVQKESRWVVDKHPWLGFDVRRIRHATDHEVKVQYFYYFLFVLLQSSSYPKMIGQVGFCKREIYQSILGSDSQSRWLKHLLPKYQCLYNKIGGEKSLNKFSCDETIGWCFPPSQWHHHAKGRSA